ncbi:YwqJ-related putative deaminase [Kitasatospora sp. NBC_01539]|uniref:YwqJ-related putative deaminase n=1 Tax=Kitasatospora sp. NBC_01539 TaxID=2903577 RepID=UPI0038601E50
MAASPSAGRETGPADRPAPDRAVPHLAHLRDSVLPAVAAALSLKNGEVHTLAGDKADLAPLLHPLVGDFLVGLPVEHRERFLGRCPEAVLLSQFLTTVDAARSKRAARKPLGLNEARKALKGARLTTVRIREEGDPAHGTHAPPCRSCAPLLDHLNVASVAVGPTTR